MIITIIKKVYQRRNAPLTPRWNNSRIHLTLYRKLIKRVLPLDNVKMIF